MIAIIVECARTESDLLVAECCDIGTAAIAEEALAEGRCRLIVYFDSEEAATKANLRLRTWRPATERTPECDWTEEARKVWRPIPIGATPFSGAAVGQLPRAFRPRSH